MINKEVDENAGQQQPKKWVKYSYLAFMKLPEILGFFWLAFLAGSVWRYAKHSHLPPLYDAFTYFEKAYNFWQAAATGRLFNPLDIAPTFRPPGTILMSYPLGFSLEPHGFFFRSVFFPAVLLFASVLVAIYNVRDKFQNRVYAILIASFVSTLPFLYHFQLGPLSNGTYWGLVDGFLSALAALGAAAAWRGSYSKSGIIAWSCFIVMAFASITCMLVKPSGAVISALIGVVFVLFSTYQLKLVWHQKATRHLVMRRSIAGAGIVFFSDFLVLIASLHSHYLSADNFRVGEENIAIMKDELYLPLSQVWTVVNSGLGIFFIFFIAMSPVTIFVSRYFYRNAKNEAAVILSVIFALFSFLFGAWFWLIAAGGGTQIRYGLPFFMMGVIWLTPGLFQVLRFSSVALSFVLMIMFLAAPINLGLILSVSNPSLTWQRLSGVSLTSHFPSKNIDAFEGLVDMPRGASAIAYSLALGTNDAVLSALAARAQLLHPKLPPLDIDRPVNWIRQSVVSVSELSRSTYIVFEPRLIDPSVLHEKTVKTLGSEQQIFATWINQLSSRNGVATNFKDNSVIIIKIVDRKLFVQSMKQFIAGYQWSSVFKERNKKFMDLPS